MRRAPGAPHRVGLRVRRRAVRFERGRPRKGLDHAVVFTSSADSRPTLRRRTWPTTTRSAHKASWASKTSLPDRTGMAFVFDEPSSGSFWMKDTLIPLSIAFVDANGLIVGIKEMTLRRRSVSDVRCRGGHTCWRWRRRGYFSSEDIRIGIRRDSRSSDMTEPRGVTACSATRSASPSGSTRMTSAGSPNAWCAAPR